MKRIICFLAALVLFAVPANAGWNLKQKDDGSAVWIDGKSVEVPVGDSGLVLELTDIATALTSFVVSHKKGKIKKVYVVSKGAYQGNSNASTLTISIGSGDTATFTPISAGATITVTTGTIGYVDSVAPADNNVDVEQGYAISVRSDGGATGPVAGTVTIVIE